jgi:hypothetical protein
MKHLILAIALIVPAAANADSITDWTFHRLLNETGKATAPLSKTTHIGGSGWWNKNKGQRQSDRQYYVRTYETITCVDGKCRTKITKTIETVQLEKKK